LFGARDCPPSTVKISPVIILESSDDKNNKEAAISLACAIVLLSGTFYAANLENVSF